MKQLDKKYYIMAACSFVGVGLVAYLWLNKDQFFIENYDNFNINGTPNDCKCNTPTNDGVIDCTCKIPVTIDPNKRPKKPEPAPAPAPYATDMKKIVKSQPSYNGIAYDTENNLILEYGATTTNSLFNINNKNNLSSLPVYYMMIIYDMFYVSQLAQKPSTTVSDAQRAGFNKYFESLNNQIMKFIPNHRDNIMTTYSKVDLNKKLDNKELENVRDYIISQFTPIVSYMNVHIYAINQIKLAFNDNSKSEFKNVENVQNSIDTLLSSYVTKMSDKKEGFVGYGNTSPSYSYYSFQSTPIIEGYEKVTAIPTRYDILTVLPAIDLSTDPAKTAVFYKDYTMVEMIDFIICLIYDLKTIHEKTLNIIEPVNTPGKHRAMGERSGSISATTDENVIKMAYRDVLQGLIRMMSGNIQGLTNEVQQIFNKDYNRGSLVTKDDLNKKNKLIIMAINKFFVSMNEVIDLINLLKEFWKEPEKDKLREISNDEIINFLKGGDGLLMKMNKNKIQEIQQNYPIDPRRNRK